MRLTERDLRVSGMVSPLSGTAAKILCIFFLATVGQSFTGQDMADMLGVTANTISPAMRQLTRLGYLQYNGKQYGWSLIPEYRQMSLAESYPQVVDNLIQKNLDNPKIFGSTPLVVSSLASCDQDQELDLANQLATIADNPKILGLSPDTAEVEHWLDYGGIDRNTPTWKFLVAEIASPDFVKAHVLQVRYEHRAWEKAGKSSREPGTGLLVYRLKMGLKGEWATPAMRCEECLRSERDCRCNGYRSQHIPDDLRDIIKS